MEVVSAKASHNRITITSVDSAPLVTKQYFSKPFNLKTAKYKILARLGRQIPVEYESAGFRKNYESTCLALWHQKGFRAPRERPVPEFLTTSRPTIGLELVEGRRLDRLLDDPHVSSSKKMEVLKTIFAELRIRHCAAILEQDHRLIHFDANTRNLIIAEDQPVHIDFEMGHLDEPIDKSAARELLKLSLQIVNQFDDHHLDDIINLIVKQYGIRHILLRIVSEVLGQRMQWLHNRRDRQRKRKNPALITKIDVAAGIMQRIQPAKILSVSAGAETALTHALETSWNGKFYQSLDDSDPRGRDMPHRYDVMQFPQRFDGSSVLDIGCNIGRICFDAKQRGAVRAVGIDNRRDVIDSMNLHYKNSGGSVELFTFNINDGLSELKNTIGEDAFDFVFALSIWSHVDQQKLWDIINYYCRKVCILEDNSPSRIGSLEGIEDIINRNLKDFHVKFMGYTTDRGVRAVFRLERQQDR